MQAFKKQKGVLTVLGILTIFAAVFCISTSVKAILCSAIEPPCDPGETGPCQGAICECCYCCSPIDACFICGSGPPCDPCVECECPLVDCELGPGGDCSCYRTE